MKIFDISPVISEDLAVWPGDQSYSRKVTMDTDAGDHIGLSSITTTLHLGAHVDAPNHYGAGSPGIDQRSLQNYFGPAQVINVNLKPGERIRPQHIEKVSLKAPRVIFKTSSFPKPEQWNDDFCALSAELVDFLATKSILLVGIDTPSIDLFADNKLESHQRVHYYNMSILEGVELKDVSEGVYTLIALPLPLKDADASPVRAVLVTGLQSRSWGT